MGRPKRDSRTCPPQCCRRAPGCVAAARACGQAKKERLRGSSRETALREEDLARCLRRPTAIARALQPSVVRWPHTAAATELPHPTLLVDRMPRSKAFATRFLEYSSATHSDALPALSLASQRVLQDRRRLCCAAFEPPPCLFISKLQGRPVTGRLFGGRHVISATSHSRGEHYAATVRRLQAALKLRPRRAWIPLTLKQLRESPLDAMSGSESHGVPALAMFEHLKVGSPSAMPGVTQAPLHLQDSQFRAISESLRAELRRRRRQ